MQWQFTSSFREAEHLKCIAELEVLRCDSLHWGCPLPRTLTALNIREGSQSDPAERLPQQLTQLGALLQGLPALELLALEVDALDSPSGLDVLLAAIQCCPLTYLSLDICSLQVI